LEMIRLRRGGLLIPEPNRQHGFFMGVAHKRVRALAVPLTLIIAAGFLGLVLTYPDRKPTATERAKIELVLKEHGFQRWDERIELEDGYWDIDEAIGPDGLQYDLKLDPRTFVIVRQDRD
jgi:hypothetical protein